MSRKMIEQMLDITSGKYLITKIDFRISAFVLYCKEGRIISYVLQKISNSAVYTISIVEILLNREDFSLEVICCLMLFSHLRLKCVSKRTHFYPFVTKNSFTKTIEDHRCMRRSNRKKYNSG